MKMIVTRTTTTTARALCFLLLFAPFACDQEKKQAAKPNVILIVLDGARAGRFGVYGSGLNITPRIDEIAKKGAVFLNHLTNGVRTRDAIPILLFSSCRPVNLFEVKGSDLEWGIRRLTPETVFDGRPKQALLLPEYMKESGCQTAIFNNILYIAEIDRLKTYFDEVFDLPFPTLNQTRDEVMVSTLLTWLRERDRNSPFFVYYHVLSPHVPYPIKEEDDYFLKGFDPDKVATVRSKYIEKDKWTKEEAEIASRLHMSNLKHSDKWVGILFDKLVEMGLTENTLIVITADHGEPLRDLQRPGRDAWNSFIKVPLVIHYPPKVTAGTKVETLTESVDIMPTILALAGVETPPGKTMDGINLIDVINGTAADDRMVYIRDFAARDHRYIYYRQDDDIDVPGVLYWEEALFDLEKDPLEEANIIAEKPEVAARLASFLEAIRSDPLLPSRRQSPPDFPFYFTVDHFQFRPPDAVEIVERFTEGQTLPARPWLLIRRHDQAAALARRGDEPSAPLILSTALPDGSYRVFLLLETAEHISLNPAELGLRVRFSPETDFILPESVEFFGNSSKGLPCYYVALGGITVTGENFSVEIDYQPRGEKLLFFRHVKFLPENIRSPIVNRWEDDITLALKIIGYLDHDDGGAGAPIRPDVSARIDWQGNLLLNKNVTLTASSRNLANEGVENLLDNNINTFWHVDEGMLGKPAWVVADFGEGNSVTVSSLAARPRVDQSGRLFGNQFFHNAVLQASHDGVNWLTLAHLVQEQKPEDESWRHFPIDNRDSYRFYRLLIVDGHQEPQKRFLSLADMAFFE